MESDVPNRASPAFRRDPLGSMETDPLFVHIAETKSESECVILNESDSVRSHYEPMREPNVETTNGETAGLPSENGGLYFNLPEIFGIHIGRGIRDEICSRSQHWSSDWLDGVRDRKSSHKLISTVLFLYFSCLLPAIAFGTLNGANTSGYFSVCKTIIAQGIGGIIHSVLSTQPLVILLSTAPLSLIIKVTHTISENENVDFAVLYAWVGIFNSIFLVLFSVFNVADIFLHYTSPFLEETFGAFVAIAFAVDAIQAFAETCIHVGGSEQPLLWIVLMFGTVYVGTQLLAVKNSRLFNPFCRVILSDFSLPIAVLVMSFIGSFAFRNVSLPQFDASKHIIGSLPNFLNIEARIVFSIALPLGFSLSILFFIDQCISAAMVHAKSNKIAKGTYYHWDIFLVAAINIVLSVLGLPWIHGALPHSPMHAQQLADIVHIERVIKVRSDNHNGNSADKPAESVRFEYKIERQVAVCRETRLSAFVSHILLSLSVFLLPIPLQFVPVPVVYGLFLYLSVTSLTGNGFFERMVGLISNANGSGAIVDEVSMQNLMEGHKDVEESESGVATGVEADQQTQSMAPRLVVTRFTLIQICCLAILCIFGFIGNPYVRITFPVWLAMIIPFREKHLKSWFGEYINILDDNSKE